MKTNWYFSKGDKQIGPVSDEELRQLAASGQLQPADLVWTDGMASWSPGNSINDLFSKPTSLPPPLPAVAATVRSITQRVTAEVQLEAIGGNHRLDRIDVFCDGHNVGKGSMSAGVHLSFESSVGSHTINLRQSSNAAISLFGSLNDSIRNFHGNNYPVTFQLPGHYTICFTNNKSLLSTLGKIVGHTLPTDTDITHSPTALENITIQLPQEPEQGLLQKGLAGASRAIQGLVIKAHETKVAAMKQARCGKLVGVWQPATDVNDWIQFTEDGAVVFANGSAGRFAVSGDEPNEVIEMLLVNGTVRTFRVVSVTTSQLVIAEGSEATTFRRPRKPNIEKCERLGTANNIGSIGTGDTPSKDRSSSLPTSQASPPPGPAQYCDCPLCGYALMQSDPSIPDTIETCPHCGNEFRTDRGHNTRSTPDWQDKRAGVVGFLKKVAGSGSRTLSKRERLEQSLEMLRITNNLNMITEDKTAQMVTQMQHKDIRDELNYIYQRLRQR